MAISLEELKKAVKTLESSVHLYGAAPEGSEERKAFRDACIQRFEYCIELSWKTSMKILGSATLAAKPAIREMARNGLVSKPEKWLLFIDARNNSSHSYEEDVAVKVYEAIQEYLVEIQELLKNLEKL